MTSLSYIYIHTHVCTHIHTHIHICAHGLPWWPSGKESTRNAGDTVDSGSIPGSGRSPGGGHGNPLQYFCVENPGDKRAWWATVHRVAKSQTGLKSEHAHIHVYIHIYTHIYICITESLCSTPETNTGFPGDSDGKESICNTGDLGSIPGLEKSPGGGHGNPFQYSCLENPHGQRGLVGFSPWGHKEPDTTVRLNPELHTQKLT